MVNVYYNYRIGDTSHSCDIDENHCEVTNNTARRACFKLKEGDGAFIFSASSPQWIYAIVATAVHISCPYIIFQITRDGSIERIDQRLWGTRVRPLRKNHPSSHYAGTKAEIYCVKLEKDDEGKQMNVHSITAMPVYANKSFEELHLEDYSAGNKGTMSGNFVTQITNNTSVRWGGSDINNFLEVDLGSERIILKRAVDGKMYTKHQCLHIIKTTTVKSSKARKRLIDFLDYDKLVPNTTALYKLLQRDEKGKSISADNWGIQLHTQQQQPINMIHWYSRSTTHHIPYIPCLTKKRTLIADASLSLGEYARYDVMNEEGWKGRIRLYMTTIKFNELWRIEEKLKYEKPQLIDICMFIGSSNVFHGKPTTGHIIPFDIKK